MRPFHTIRCRVRAVLHRAPLAGRASPLILIPATVIVVGCCGPQFGGAFPQQHARFYNVPPGQIVQQHQFLPPNVVNGAQVQPKPVATGTAPGATTKEQLPWDPANGSPQPANNGGSGTGLVPEYKFDPSDNSATKPRGRSAFGSGGSTFDGGPSSINPDSSFDPNRPIDSRSPFKRETPGGSFGSEKQPFESGGSSGSIDDVREPFGSEATTPATKPASGSSDILDELEKRKSQIEKPKGNFKRDPADDTFEPFKEAPYDSGSASFQPPMKISPDASARPIYNASVATTVQVVAAESEVETSKLNAASLNLDDYAYDEVAFKWLQGKVDYDESEGMWQIMYSVAPDRTDPYGGAITLSDDPRLKALRKSDVVLVGGFVDEASKDAFGKPVYQIEKISVFE